MPRWNRLRILRELEKHARFGVVPSIAVLPRGLYLAICAEFGGIAGACKAAGLRPAGQRKAYSEKETLRELRKQSQRGVGPRSHDLPRGLRRAVKQHFGGIAAARVAAGLARPDARLAWSKDRVIAELVRQEAAGVRMTCGSLNQAGQGALVHAALRWFGSFENARRAAGITAPEPLPPRRQSLEQYPTKDAAIAELRRIAKKRKRPHRSAEIPSMLGTALRRHFGSYAAARETAGLPPVHPKWSRETVLEELRSLARQGVRMTGSGIREAGRNDLLIAMYRHVGNMEKARKLAGLPANASPRSRPRRTRDGLN